MDVSNLSVVYFLIEIGVFLILMGIGIFIRDKLNSSDSRFLNPSEFLPEEELHTLRQVSYLILMSLCFINLVYNGLILNSNVFYLVLFDIALSLFIAITIDKSSIFHKILVILLIPFGSLSFLIFSLNLIGLLDLIHIPIFIYMIYYYYSKFKQYTENNSLGLAIILLFVIIFISFFITQFAESVNPLDAIVMVSNAFTSNGYAVLGSSIPGKINSVFLVWGGYIISGVGTATLTAAILIRQFNKRIEELEKIIDEGVNND